MMLVASIHPVGAQPGGSSSPGPDSPAALDRADLPGGIVGMYIHQHWPHRHPYAART
jgi:hypothetical protein